MATVLMSLADMVNFALYGCEMVSDFILRSILSCSESLLLGHEVVWTHMRNLGVLTFPHYGKLHSRILDVTIAE